MVELIQQLANGLVLGSTYSIVALGFALVFNVMDVINLAHPDLIMVGGFIAILVAEHVTGSVPMIIIAVLLGTGLFGVILERVVLRPLRGKYILIPLIATAGVSRVLQYGCAAIFGSLPVVFPHMVSASRVSLGGVSLTTTQLITVGATALVMAFAFYYVQRTPWGLASRAIAEQPTVTGAFGINVNRVSQMTVVLASMLAGVAALTVGVQYGTAWAFVGNLYATKAFVCMLVAGNRNLFGVLIIGEALGVLEALVTTYVSSSYTNAVAFMLLIVVLIVRPTGVFGSFKAR